MPTFLFRCPTTRFRVQGYRAEEIADDDAYEAVTCTACLLVHMVNPKKGKVLGQDADE